MPAHELAGLHRLAAPGGRTARPPTCARPVLALTMAGYTQRDPSMSRTLALLALAGALGAATAYTTPAIAQEAQASGEVRRVNAPEGKITIKHGAISELQLPAMSLVYHASP